MINRRGSLVLFSVLLLAVCGSLPVAGADDPPSTEDKKSQLALYLWATGIDGDFTVMGNTVPVDVSFDELFDTVEIAASFHYEYHFQPWGVFGDVTYIDTLSEFVDPGSGMAATSELPFVLAEAGAYRRFGVGANATTVDLLFGVRYWSLDQTLTITGAPMPFTGDQSWTDVIAGARILVPFGNNDKWLFISRLDVGAGGSESAWNALAMFDWKFSKVASLIFGYRFLKEDYEDGAGSTLFALDATFDGPVVAVGFRW